MKKRVSITTLGCRLNQADGEAIRASFERAGYEVVPFGETADVCVVNTCTVTAEADHQSRQFLNRAVRAKTGDGLVVATGCYAQSGAESLNRLVAGLDAIIGNPDKYRIPQIIEHHPGTRIEIVRDTDDLREYTPMRVGRFTEHSRALLRIQEGCNRRCAYCVVPSVRGRERSAPLDEIVSAARETASNGFPELVITGIHIGRYGADLEPRTSLAALLIELAEIEPLRRIRLSSIDPREFSDELFDSLHDIRDKLCPHFHVSLQSGDNSILRAMRRDYSVEDFSAVVGRLCSMFADACIGADVIVGFPGESDKCFETTKSALQSLPLAYFHVFRYSKRPGTAAASMPGQMEADVKKARARDLGKLRSEKLEAFRQKFAGQELEVLFETRRDRETGLLMGTSRNYINIYADAPDSMTGLIAVVKTSETLFKDGLKAVSYKTV